MLERGEKEDAGMEQCFGKVEKTKSICTLKMRLNSTVLVAHKHMLLISWVRIDSSDCIILEKLL